MIFAHRWLLNQLRLTRQSIASCGDNLACSYASCKYGLRHARRRVRRTTARSCRMEQNMAPRPWSKLEVLCWIRLFLSRAKPVPSIQSSNMIQRKYNPVSAHRFHSRVPYRLELGLRESPLFCGIDVDYTFHRNGTSTVSCNRASDNCLDHVDFTRVFSCGLETGPTPSATLPLVLSTKCEFQTSALQSVCCVNLA